MNSILFKILIVSGLLLVMAMPKTALSQTPTDAIMMEKGQLCVAAIYGHDSWDEYWEGTYKRSNGNIGTLTRQSVTGMFSLGITDRINVLGGLPWMKTSSTRRRRSRRSGVMSPMIRTASPGPGNGWRDKNS